MLRRLLRLKQVLFIGFFCSFAHANSGITYHGRLLRPDGLPVASSNVRFRLQIRTPGTEDCLMYEEVQNLDLSQTAGVFSLSLGDGNGVRQDGYPWTIFDSFSNRKSFSFNAGDCQGGTTYAPNTSDNRNFRVFFNDGSFPVGTWEALPIQTINFIPMAIESYGVGGFTAASLLRVEDSGTLGNTSPLSTLQYNEILALTAGTSSLYSRAGQLNGSALPSFNAGESMRWNGSTWQAFTPIAAESDPTVQAFAKASLPSCAADERLTSDGTNLNCESVSGAGWSAVDATESVKGIVSVPASGGLVVSSGAISLTDQTLTPGDFTKVSVDQKGRVTAGASLDESDIPQLTSAGNGVDGSAITGDLSVTDITASNLSATGISTRQLDLYDSDNSNHIALRAPATADLSTNYTLVLPNVLGTSNQVLGMNNSGTALENKSILAGSGVSVTHSAGGIQISATGSGGTLTSVSGTSPIQVSGTATDPVISLEDTGTAGTYGSSTQFPVITTDEKGRVSNVTLQTISTSPVGSALEEGQVWIGDSSDQAVSRHITAADIRSSTVPYNTVFSNTSCTSAQTLTWSSLTDVFNCTDISIDASQVANLPSGDLWSEAGADIYFNTGNVGIGTQTPEQKLHLVGTSGNTLRIVDGNEGLGKVLTSDANGVASWADPAGGGGSGTVTSITAGSGLSGGTITDTGTIAIADSGVTTAKLFTPVGVRRIVATDASTGNSLSPLSCSAGQVLKWNDSLGWQCAADSVGTGTVTSVGLSMPAMFTVTNSPVTTSGTLTASLASQTANQVFSAPNGSNGAPSFRALAANDIPNLDTSKLTSGTLAISRGGTGRTSYSNNAIMVTNAIGAPDAGVTCSTSGHVLSWNGTSWVCSSSSGDHLGNHTATQNLNLNGHWLSGDGTNDGLFLSSTGSSGFGTALPQAKMHVKDLTDASAVLSLGSDDAVPTSYFLSDTTSQTSTGNDWVNLDNIKLANGATTDVPLSGSASSKTLVVTGFNLNLDPSATVVGIEVRIRGRHTSALMYGNYNGMRLLKGGAAVGTAHSAVDTSYNFTTPTFGGANNLWGTTWTVADLNAPGFGVQFRVTNGCCFANNVYLDYVQVRVHYLPPTIAWKVGVDGADNGKFKIASDQTYTQAEERLVITQLGEVGIGTSDPTELFQVGSNADGSAAVANAWNTFSDQRLKTNIQKIVNASSLIERLSGYYYEWKNGSDRTRQVGVMAQEVREVLPELVKEGKSGVLTVDYSKLNAVLIEAVKELKNENRELKSRLESIEERLNSKP